MRRFVSSVVGAVVAGVLVTGCATSPMADRPVGQQPDVDWSNPAHGVPVASMVAAQSLSPFPLHEPGGGLGTPQSIFVTGSGGPSPVFVFVYGTSRYGLVDVYEELPDVPPAEYDAANQRLLAYNGLPSTHGSSRIVSIRGGCQALMTVSEDGSRADIRWLEGGVEYYVRGPSLSTAVAIQVAEGI